MAMKKTLRFAALAASILAVAACVYPFDPVIESEDGRLVVEGDIHAGEISSFNITRVIPMDSDAYYSRYVYVRGYIEGEDGSRIEQIHSPSYDYAEINVNSISFDTSSLSDSQRYRLHFEDFETGMAYESDWIEINPAPVIDNLSYILDEDRDELNVALSMHCNGRSHFRWHYAEEWEYHSREKATHYYVPETGEVKQFENGENTYFCWRSYYSPEIKIFSTADQVDDRFVDLEFHRIPRTEQRLQVMYHITVYLEAIDEQAYKYWDNIQQNSQNQGTIFSPMPSQMTGNIHCVSDPSVPVIGYIGASRQAVADMYYDNSVEYFYRQPPQGPMESVDLEDTSQFAYYHSMGYALCYVTDDMMGPTVYTWVQAVCADCRRSGGTKTKPAGWPNDHK